MTPGPAVLLIESDRSLADALAGELAADGYSVRMARSAEHARSLAGPASLSLVVLGRLERPCEATELLEELRGRGERPGWEQPDMPVLVLGSRAGGLEALRAFEAGADDYMAKPVFYLELRARLRALERRASTARGATRLEVGSLAVELDARRATLGGHSVVLSRMEFELLARLARSPDSVLTRAELLLAVWGHGPGASTRTLDTHASRLRRKLNAISGLLWIPNVRGVGYRLH